MLNGMLVIPYISPVLVGNLGVLPGDIMWIYMAGGVAAFFSSRLVGTWSDRAGRQKVFRVFVLFSVVPILVVTHLSQISPLAAGGTGMHVPVPHGGDERPQCAAAGADDDRARSA
jgi:DHA1 family inner membrane transport protein